ncbi:MAG: acyl-CoA/acyl-ACP dehydrogenase [Actinobacteria bacterium]|nr:acyl-CoA/acyl-ACP dehydrogenase [Actinomycetota bacterium]
MRAQQRLQQLVREVARRRIAPAAADHRPGDEVPSELFALLAELDLLGLPFPAEDGGGDQPGTVVCDVLAELSQAFLPVGLGAAAHLVGAAVVAAHAQPELRAAVLPRLVAGEWLASFGFPPDVHRAPTAVDQLRADHDGGHYVLEGVATGVAHAGMADCFVLFCTTTQDGADPLIALLVPADTVGLGRPRSGSDPTSPVSAVRCSQVRIPVDHRLGVPQDGEEVAVEACDASRVGVAACAVGLARAALQIAITCVRDHRATVEAAYESAAADGVAELATAVEAADALCQRAAAARDAGRDASLLAAMASLAATDTAARVAESAGRLASVAGWHDARPVARYRQEATALQRVEGVHRAQVSHIAGQLVGERGRRADTCRRL